MAKAYFPMFVDISEIKIIVVGGGNIASRRIAALVMFASDITVIAPEVTNQIKELEASGKVRCICRAYQEGDLADADMVLAATDNRDVNTKVAADCRENESMTGRKIVLNVADDRFQCDFYFPSVIVRDEIVIGINSGGQDPAKVKRVRRRLQDELEQ